MIKSNNNTPFLGSFFNGGKMRKTIILLIFLLILLNFNIIVNASINSNNVIDIDYQNYDFEDFNDNLNSISYIDSEPSITFLTPGLGVEIEEWGMEKTANDEKEFQNFSIISYLKRRNSSIYAISIGNEDNSINKIMENAKNEDTVILEGRVQSIDKEWSDSLGTMSFYISDGGKREIIRDCNIKVEVGDHIKVTGQIEVIGDFKSLSSVSTVEKIEIQTSVEKAFCIENDQTIIIEGGVCEIISDWNEETNKMSFYISDGHDKILVNNCIGKVTMNEKVRVKGTITTVGDTKQLISDCIIIDKKEISYDSFINYKINNIRYEDGADQINIKNLDFTNTRGIIKNSVSTLDELTINDFNKPIVVLIYPQLNNDGHNIYAGENKALAYNELEALVNGFIYKYMSLKRNENNPNPKIPKINMIGHSRGGILNMLYAIQHPNIVDTLVSIGTPYNGSTMLNIDGSAGIYNLIMNGDENEISSINYGMIDCMDENIYNQIKNDWNRLIADGCKTKLITIGSTMTLGLIEKVFKSQKLSNIEDNYIFNKTVNNISAFVENSYLNISGIENYYDKFATSISQKRIYKYLESSKIDKTFIESLANVFIEFFSIDDYLVNNCINCNVEEIECKCTSKQIGIINALYNLFKHICENTYYDFTVQSENEYGDFIYEGDLFVNLSSQLAYGYNSAITYEKVFTEDITENLDKLKVDQFIDVKEDDDPLMYAIGHNLERIDEDIIRCVLSNLYLGNNDNGLIINENNEIIGYNYEAITRNESNGVLNIPGGYTISSKMFGIDKNSAQAKRDADFLDENEEFRLSHNIKEISFLGETFIEDGAFTYLTNQVKFSKIEGDLDLTGENNKVYSVENGSLYSYINNKKILEKFGSESVNEYSKIANLSNIDIIQSGAFFCQNIEQTVIYSELKEIGDYAFYGCNNLKEILYEEDYINNVNNIGSWVLNHTNIYKKNRNLVVCGYLVKYDKTKDVLKTSDFSNLKGIASGVFIKNKNLKTLILDTPNIKINSNAFIDTPIEGIFIETVTETGSLGLIIDDDSFVRIGKIEINENGRRTRNFKVYSEYPINFLGVESDQEIEIKVVDTNGNDVTTENINFVVENYEISINEFEYTNNLLLGYSYNNEKKDYRELLETVDITKVYNSNLYALFSCSEEHCELTSNYTYESIDYELHLSMCQNCDYSIKENHDGSNIENGNNQFDRFTCAKCGCETAHIHDYYEEFKEINGIIQHEKTCNICSYHFICSYEMNVEVQGNNHIVSCGECNSEIIYENHNYYTMDYENFDILVCIYCEEHICNGVNYYIDNTTHSVLCSYCREEKICSHVFNEESEYVNQNSNPDNGYHTSTCLICEETIQLDHYYEIAEDNHTLTCRDCNVVYVLTYPDAGNNYNSDLYHIYYCDMCEVYHTELHDLEYFEDGVSCIDGHYQRCSICQRVDILEEHSFEIKSIGSIGHVDECSICGYQTEIETHTLVANCSDSFIDLHHYECVDCDYCAHIPKEYEIYHEYEHFIICSECNGRQTQNHLEYCYPMDGECHMYTCTICNIAYEMPHYVNDMGEAIYYDETYYTMWCHYCGYTELKEHEEDDCPCGCN